MKKIIIHVGYPKTATTTLQKSIFPKVRSVSYVEDTLNPSGNIKKDKLKSRERALISNERVLGLKYSYIGKDINIKKNFEDENAEVKILFTIRSQNDILKSAFTFYYGLFRKKGYNNINTLVENEIGKKKKMELGDWLDYNNVIKQFEGTFGNENVFVLKYEDFSHKREEFYESLSRVTGENRNYIKNISRNMPSYNVQPKKGKNKHMKPSKIYTWFSHFKSRHLSNMKPVSDYLFGGYIKQLISSFNKEVYLSEKSKDIIHERYANSNGRLFDRFNLGKYGEYPMSENS